MGQPAFSQAIANLETIAGVKLMTRTTRSLQLTPAGVVFLLLKMVEVNGCAGWSTGFWVAVAFAPQLTSKRAVRRKSAFRAMLFSCRCICFFLKFETKVNFFRTMNRNYYNSFSQHGFK
jgi:hypothetical protein